MDTMADKIRSKIFDFIFAPLHLIFYIFAEILDFFYNLFHKKKPIFNPIEELEPMLDLKLIEEPKMITDETKDMMNSLIKTKEELEGKFVSEEMQTAITYILNKGMIERYRAALIAKEATFMLSESNMREDFTTDKVLWHKIKPILLNKFKESNINCKESPGGYIYIDIASLEAAMELFAKANEKEPKMNSVGIYR